jgi:nicotinamide phosphoribosyltransferase
MDINPIFLIDFYKVGHVDQYPEGIKRIWVNFTPRSTRVEGETGVIFFGLQRFIRKVLIDQFENEFFNRDLEDLVSEYRTVIQKTLGVANPRTDHIERLWRHGMLPLDIYAVPEGTYVPLGVPAMVIVNNEDWAFWLPNYIETMASNNLWHACTSATTAHRYRRIFIQAALAAGEKDLSFIDWQGHDFSYRGLSGFDSAVLSGMGHLLSFSGTDTLPAILEAADYYHADLSVGGSVPATEHSVMCAGSQGGEEETFRRLIEDVYPNGIVSIVSDTWDLWKVLTTIVPNLKDKILARNGKVVIRPDSGDPVKILTGDPDTVCNIFNYDPRFKGALRLLAKAVGTTEGPGGELLNKMGLIYGDSITPSRAKQILDIGIVQGFSPYNFVFGIGSYTYQYVTRDTYNFAFKATAIEREVPAKSKLEVTEDGKFAYEMKTERIVEAIFKDPVTDNAHKKSHRGIPVAIYKADGSIGYIETLDPSLLSDGDDKEIVNAPGLSAFRKVFDGDLLIDEDFESIRTRVRTRDLEPVTA